MRNYIIGLIFVFILCSCKNEYKNRILNDTFVKQDSLVAQKIPIKEILNPANIVLLKDYIVIQNEYLPNESCFYIYKKGDSYPFLFSFGRLGQGAEEFIAPSIVNNNKDNEISILDNARNIIYKYKIHDDSAEKISEHRLKNVVYPFQELSYVNDSILLYRILYQHGNMLYSYNINTGTTIDSLSYESSFKNRMGNKYNSTLDIFNFSNYQNDFVVAFNYINEIKRGRLTSDFTFEDKYSNQLEQDDFVPYTNNALYENFFYYMFPVMTDKYIYAIYMGRIMKQLQPMPINMGKRYFDAYIEVYDKEINPIKRLKLDNDFMRIAVDENNNVFYTWDPLKDFDYLLKYNLK